MEALLAFMFAVGMWNLRHFLREYRRERRNDELWRDAMNRPEPPPHRDPYLEHERRKQLHP